MSGIRLPFVKGSRATLQQFSHDDSVIQITDEAAAGDSSHRRDADSYRGERTVSRHHAYTEQHPIRHPPTRASHKQGPGLSEQALASHYGNSRQFNSLDSTSTSAYSTTSSDYPTSDYYSSSASSSSPYDSSSTESSFQSRRPYDPHGLPHFRDTGLAPGTRQRMPTAPSTARRFASGMPSAGARKVELQQSAARSSAIHGLTYPESGVDRSGSSDAGSSVDLERTQPAASTSRPPPGSLPSEDEDGRLPSGVTQPPMLIGDSSDLNLEPLPSKFGSSGETRGGYDADFDPPLDEKNRCNICQFAVRDPVQTYPCGHRFCRSCLLPLMSTKQLRCPVTDCREAVEAANPDNFCKREVLNLRVKCNNSIASCEWTGQLKELKNHLGVCPYSVVNCGYSDRGCSAMLQRRLLQDHMEKECGYGDVTCQHCHKKMVKAEIEHHVLEECLEVEVKCRLCQAPMRRSQITAHLASECPFAEQHCPFSDMGCDHLAQRSALVDHMSSDVVSHVTLLHNSLQSKDAKIKELEKKYEQMLVQFEQLVQQSSIDRMAQRELVARLTEAEERITYLKSLEGKTAELSQHLEEIQNTGSTASEERIQRLETRVEDAVLQATQAGAKATTASQNAEAAKSRSTNFEHQLAAVNQIIGRTDAIMAEFDLRLLAQETTSFSGIMIWKIPDYKRHYDEARSGKKPSLYSPPFFTSRHGYKLCARVYLNGDGVGKSSHMSIFFVVMRGEFDSLLPWPFHQKVTLTLLDQSPAKKHISDTFLPDPNSSSFQRPTSEMNIASGCPRQHRQQLLAEVSLLAHEIQQQSAENVLVWQRISSIRLRAKPSQRRIVVVCPGLDLRIGDVFLDWYRRPRGGGHKRSVNGNPDYSIDTTTKRLDITTTSRGSVADYEFECAYGRPKERGSDDGKANYTLREERGQLLTLPETPSVQCPRLSANGQKIRITWEEYPSQTRLNYEIKVSVQFLSANKPTEILRTIPSRKQRCKKKVCARARGIALSQAGQRFGQVETVEVWMRATAGEDTSSDWIKILWPLCQVPAMSTVAGEASHAWIVARQASATSLRIMWSYLFGEIGGIFGWKRRARLEVNIRGEPNDESKMCKSQKVVVPTFGSRASSAVHALDVHGLTPGCDYTIDGKVKYVAKTLFAPAETDLVATGIEASTTIHMSSMKENPDFTKQFVALLLNFEVDPTFPEGGNQTHIEGAAARLAYLSLGLCGASFLNMKLKDIAVVRRTKNCPSAECVEVSYPLQVQNDALLFKECFLHQVVVISDLNEERNFKVTRSNVYDERRKLFI